jgi:hypothetical protein
MTAVRQIRAQRTEVPIMEVTLSNGTRRYAVPLKIDGQEVLAGLDTGSAGLRVFPKAGLQLQTAGPVVSETFGSGVIATGPVATASIAIGDITRTIDVQEVTGLKCAPNINSGNCGADRISPDQFGILGDGLPGEGFSVLIGIRAEQDTVPTTPLSALGVQRWIVDLPQPGSRRPGRLILNPEPWETMGFIPVQTQHDPGEVAGCFSLASESATICLPVLFDTGTTEITVESNDFKATGGKGDSALLTLGDLPDAISLGIKLDDPWQNSNFKVKEPSRKGPMIQAGVLPYFSVDVLYEPDKKSISLRPRPPYPGGPRLLPIGPWSPTGQ